MQVKGVVLPVTSFQVKVILPAFRSDALAFFIFALKKASASDRNVGMITNNQKLVFGEPPISHA